MIPKMRNIIIYQVIFEFSFSTYVRCHQGLLDHLSEAAHHCSFISWPAPSYPYNVTATTDRLKLVVNISWSLEDRSVQEYVTIKLCQTSSTNCPVHTYKVWPDDSGVFPTSFAISWSELNSTAGVYNASMSATSHGLNSSETKPSAFRICEFDVTVHSDTRDLLLI